MSNRYGELFLFDILVAILKIREVARNFPDAAALKRDFMAWDSVIREFEVIGEATGKLIRLGILPQEYQVIVDFRNLLIHRYFGIDPEEVWNVIQNNLGEFTRVILEKISHLDATLKGEIIQDLMEENKYLDFVTAFLQNLQR
ncbi:MAG: DUF86 domain-containing protein [Candidatus Atribacteria bacterium]|nr:DUF86 domain-containing protein [Candidatus Atribacteria bacterium]